MEKINVAELLKDCPKGMELDCTMFDDVQFIAVDEAEKPICIRTKDAYRFLTKFGTWTFDDDAKCVIFPKGKTTWEGFVLPCQFKDGDIVFVTSKVSFRYIAIFKQIRNNELFVHCFYSYRNDIFGIQEDLCDNPIIRFATEKEKEKLFATIKANGYKWNPESKTLEKLVEPKFKVGDRIQSKNFIEERTIKICEEDGYWTTVDSWIRISDQDNWELIPNKFDINTLVPFESKVLVRAADNQFWRPAIWGVKQKDWDFCCVVGGEMWEQCIPYECNEHLRGKTNDCADFYKFWE